jgi:HAE1 family hydrophobic/amphiphilic exporter-1
MGSTGSAVSINIKGENIDILQQISDNVIQQISKIEGIRNPKSSLTSGRPEMRVVVDREKASAYGLTGAQVSGAVRMALEGSVATTL